MQPDEPSLVDRFGRVHTNLRVSVTDRCNIRCFYCMPEHDVQFKPRHEILTFEEIQRFVGIAARRGVNKIRLTGGEPLVRNSLPDLIAGLKAIPGIEEVAMTTNGVLLESHADALYRSGLDRLNISLDTLDEDTFFRISRRKGLQKVLDGIAAAKALPFKKIRLNSIAMSQLTESEIVPLAEFSRRQMLELRFIEFMPLDANDEWETGKVLSGEFIRETIESRFGPLIPVDPPDPSQPATDFRYSDMDLRVGLINPVTQPFCGSCNRLRLTAEGQIRNCLFSTVEFDARKLLRGNAGDDEIEQLLVECVQAKKAGHGIDDENFVRPERSMYQIGG